MEPTAQSLTEEDLTEVKKDVSSTTLPGHRRGPGTGGAGGGCIPAGEETQGPSPSRNRRRSPRSEKRNVRAQQDHGEPCIRGTLVEVI